MGLSPRHVGPTALGTKRVHAFFRPRLARVCVGLRRQTVPQPAHHRPPHRAALISIVPLRSPCTTAPAPLDAASTTGPLHPPYLPRLNHSPLRPASLLIPRVSLIAPLVVTSLPSASCQGYASVGGWRLVIVVTVLFGRRLL